MQRPRTLLGSIVESLLRRARAYAERHGIEIVVVEGPVAERCSVVRYGELTLLYLDSGTAASSQCGEVVYRACEAIAASRALQINVHLSHLKAS